MPCPFPADFMLIFGFLSLLLLLGVFFRARLAIFQKYLFPSCLIGGIIGLGVVHFGDLGFETPDLETFAYHLFNISFISVGLTYDKKPAESVGSRKDALKGPVWMALVQGCTFPAQAIVGGLAVMLFGWFGLSLFPTFGFLGPLGFNEGPGQALSFGKVWEGIGFSDAATIGLTFAAIGYFFAFFVGVPLVNWGIRKGISFGGRPGPLPKDLLTGLTGKDQDRESAGRLTIHTGNMETLAFQTALVGGVYVLTYGVVWGLGRFIPDDAASMLWGFFFFFGLATALLTKSALVRFGVGHLLDPGIQRRITGWSVDYLMVSTVAAIQLAVVWDYFFPLLTISLANGIVTTLGVFYLGRRVPGYSLERTVAIYGTVTGTVSCGLLLLRIVDPDFKTPVALEVAVMNVFVLPIIAGCTLLVNAPVWWDWGLPLTILVYAAILAISLAFLKILRLWGKPQF